MIHNASSRSSLEIRNSSILLFRYLFDSEEYRISEIKKNLWSGLYREYLIPVKVHHNRRTWGSHKLDNRDIFDDGSSNAI